MQKPATGKIPKVTLSIEPGPATLAQKQAWRELWAKLTTQIPVSNTKSKMEDNNGASAP